MICDYCVLFIVVLVVPPHAMTSVNADVVLWPRHEVHQLVNTPLAQHGKHLTHSLVMDIARQLAKIQSSDKSIR